MKQFRYVITDEAGIHARPAGLLVKEAGQYKANIKIKKGEKEADAKRLFGIMGLGVKKGEEVIVTIEGEDEDVAEAAMAAFLKANL